MIDLLIKNVTLLASEGDDGVSDRGLIRWDWRSLDPETDPVVFELANDG